jgi:multidrug efflux pump subunit AcrA (membrane-fusion protein)
MRSPLLSVLLLALSALPACRPHPEAHAVHGDHGHTRETPAGEPREGPAGMRTEPLGLRSMEGELLTSGSLAVDPRRMVQVSARAVGRADEVLAFEGDRVAAGQPLMRMAAPAFLASQSEVLQAARRLEEAVEPRDRDLAASLMEAAQMKLRLMGMTPDEMEGLLGEGHFLPLLTVRAPLAGTILKSDAVAGAAIENGAPLFTIADLSVLLARAELYDEHLGRLGPDAGARIEVHAYPGRAFTGRLIAVGDLMDEASRTVKVRVEVPNPGRLLKAGMFADIVFTLPGGPPVAAVPEAAVRTIDGRTVVFILEEGRYAAREVRTGRKAAGWVEILDGARVGERVAVEGSLGLKGELLKGDLEGHDHD